MASRQAEKDSRRCCSDAKEGGRQTNHGGRQASRSPLRLDRHKRSFLYRMGEVFARCCEGRAEKVAGSRGQKEEARKKSKKPKKKKPSKKKPKKKSKKRSKKKKPSTGSALEQLEFSSRTRRTDEREIHDQDFPQPIMLLSPSLRRV